RQVEERLRFAAGGLRQDHEAVCLTPRLLEELLVAESTRGAGNVRLHEQLLIGRFEARPQRLKHWKRLPELALTNPQHRKVVREVRNAAVGGAVGAERLSCVALCSHSLIGNDRDQENIV